MSSAVGMALDVERLKELILLHLYRYGPDEPWLMARRLLGAAGYAPKYDERSVEEACIALEKCGLVMRRSMALKRGPTSSVKPWLKNRAREGSSKRARCVLTKEGRRAASKIHHLQD